MESKKKVELRVRRHRRLRKKILGTSERPRVAVFKSLKHFYAQAIDDTVGHTLVTSNSLVSDLRTKPANASTTKEVAVLFAGKMKEAGIKKIVFDHGGFGYRGKIKIFADTLREQGMEF